LVIDIKKGVGRVAITPETTIKLERALGMPVGFAGQELPPKKAFNAFTAQAPFSKAAICRFADDVGIAPGIVVGQLQHKGLLPTTHCKDLKVRYQWGHE
jgi:hypothetical protein